MMVFMIMKVAMAVCIVCVKTVVISVIKMTLKVKLWHAKRLAMVGVTIQADNYNKRKLLFSIIFYEFTPEYNHQGKRHVKKDSKKQFICNNKST